MHGIAATKTATAAAALQRGDLSFLTRRLYREDELRRLAATITAADSFGTVFRLVDSLPGPDHRYDRNVARLLWFFDVDLILESMRHLDRPEQLRESAGISWILGESGRRDRFIIDHLEATLRGAASARAWWFAAHALEKLGAGDAVVLMKRSLSVRSLSDLETYLKNISDYRSLIGILLTASPAQIRQIVYPRLKTALLAATEAIALANCTWLVGRLRLDDDLLAARLAALASHERESVRHAALTALVENAAERHRRIFETTLATGTPQLQCLAAAGLVRLGGERSLETLAAALQSETDPIAVAAVSSSLVTLRDPGRTDRLRLEREIALNESGAFSQEGGASADPLLSRAFADAIDPDQVCFDLIARRLTRKRLRHPIDLATGTGRLLWQIAARLPFSGTLTGVDASAAMCDFVERRIDRERAFGRPLAVIRSAIADLAGKIKHKSNFIVSAFGFPALLGSNDDLKKNLAAIHDLLDDAGELYTIGWDETADDDLARLRFTYLHDEPVWDFDAWRARKVERADSSAATGLTWLIRGLRVPLRFRTVREAAAAMGHLFGRDAAREVIRTGRTEWTLSLGITRDTKKSLKKMLGGT